MKYLNKRKVLKIKIAQKKDTLNNLLDSESLSSYEVIQLSLEIDKLIVEYLNHKVKRYKLKSSRNSIKADEF